MIRAFLSLLTEQFGFDNLHDFSTSLIHRHLLWITIPVVGLGIYVEKAFGLSVVTMGAFICLLSIELITGIVASRIKGKKIQSKKFGRFGLKLFVWISLFFIVHSLQRQYEGEAIGYFYGWLHAFIVGYVTMEYVISVLENLAVISGKQNSIMVKLLRKKWMKWLDTGDVEEPKEFRKKLDKPSNKLNDNDE